MKILVTGANGYLGVGIVKQLLDDGLDVIAADFDVDLVDCRANKKACNLFEIENPYEYFERPDILLHLAWKDGFKHDSLAHINNLPEHYMFINKLILSGIKRVCILGSMHEVGFFEGSINETTATNPQSLYGISKNALRQAVELAAKNRTEFQWIRGFYIVGNSEYGCSIFSKITQAEHEGKEKFPFTSGEKQFDFLDYNDFCNQVAKVAEQNEVTGIINCCSGKPCKLSERVERFISENHYNIKLEYGAFPDRPYDSKAVWGDAKIIDEIMHKLN